MGYVSLPEGTLSCFFWAAYLRLQKGPARDQPRKTKSYKWGEITPFIGVLRA